MGGTAKRILLIENEPSYAELIRRSFEDHTEHYHLTILDTFAQARASIQSTIPDLVLADLALTDGEGIELASDAFPLIIMASHGDEASAVEAIKNGALDYVVKSNVTLRDMPHIVERALREWTHILERRQAEAALRESEARYRLLAEHATDMISQHASDGTWLYVSPASREILGYEPKALIGRQLQEYVHPEDQERMRTLFVDGRTQSCGSIQVYRMRSKGGSYIWVETTSKFMRYSEPDAPEGIIAVTRDITERREMEAREEKLRKHAEEQQRLTAVGQLAAGIAHDFNNILTGIIGYAELVSASPSLPENVQADLRVIIDQGKHAAQLVLQILDFSRRSIRDKRSLELGTLLKETVKLLQRTIPENIRVELDKRDEDYTIQANLIQIQQILTNLAVNARDAMPEGGRIQIDLRRLTVESDATAPVPNMPAGEWVCLSFSDTGEGMDASTLQRAYEPFFTTKTGKGTGLGLSQVYGVIKQHDGFIDLESKVGEGTTFRIYLPLASPKIPEASPIHEYRLPRGHGEGILIVEDEPSVLNVTMRLLSLLGYQILSAQNGRQALETYEAHRNEIDLVLTDAVMPEMGGLELCEILAESNPDIRIIVMSGYPVSNSETPPASELPYQWIQKPLNFEQLAAKVREALDPNP